MLLVSCVPPASAAGAAEQTRRAIVLPLDFRAGGSDRDKADAQTQLNHSLQLALKRVQVFEPVAMPALTAEETAALRDHVVVLNTSVLAARFYDEEFRGIWGDSSLRPDYNIGTGLAWLGERSGADVAIGLFGARTGGGTGEVRLLTFASDPGTYMITQLAVGIVELKTGDIVWMNFVDDIKADVTKRGGSNAYLLAAFGDYPKSKIVRKKKAPDAPAAKRHVDKGAGFAVDIPGGWQRVRLMDEDLMISRHGSILDRITIELTDIPANSDPLALAARSVAALKARPLYQFIETDAVARATVGGREGFRAELSSGIHYSWGKVIVRHVLYGVATDDGTYLIRLQAPALGYFERDLPEFEKLVAGFAFAAP